MSEMPGAGQTVLIHVPGDTEPVWFGFWDGRRWHYIEGLPVRGEVRHWCGVPEPPNSVVPMVRIKPITEADRMAEAEAEAGLAGAAEPFQTVA